MSTREQKAKEENASNELREDAHARTTATTGTELVSHKFAATARDTAAAALTLSTALRERPGRCTDISKLRVGVLTHGNRAVWDQHFESLWSARTITK